MTETTTTNGQFQSQPTQPTILALEQGQARVGQLLAGLQNSAPAAEEIKQGPDARFENQLALVRLGMASSLFYALRTKHAPTAAHCLRVALRCSGWSERMGLDEATRDRIEVAALLHDLGKIGIPDRILRKPGKLSVDEQLMMDCCPQLGCEILRGCTSDIELLDIVQYASTWFDSRREGDGPRGCELPLGARMLAIADAFDAMTTDTVYRSALSRERAIKELIQRSYAQFDPDLAADFSRMLEDRPELLQGVVVDRWLRQLQPHSGDALWGTAIGDSGPQESVRRESLFHQQLLSNLKDGVAFTDGEGTITQWNEVMQDLTGIASDAIVGQSWSSECVRIRDLDDTRDDECLLQTCLRSGVVISKRMLIEQPGGDSTPVHLQVSPVFGSAPGIHGAVVILRDQSDQSDLEEKLESLHHQTTRDPLTGIANRAFFDQTLEELMATTSAGGPSFSLIMCDIDHFKRVNDVHGHPAGDEALVSFAAILSTHSREADLVARYGGEEFLLLAPCCDNPTAAKRAEAIRRALESTPLPSIGNEPVTASFGVTESQSGDTAESVVARADRALLKAKDNGRNRVIQLGSGSQLDLAPEGPKKLGWFHWFSQDDQSNQAEFDVVTPVPVDLAIEKLRGFIADHNAEIISVEENQVTMKVKAVCSRGGRRRVDQQIALHAQLTLSELHGEEKSHGPCQTNVHINLKPIRNRDRRGPELSGCFTQLVMSLRSYLMGELRKTDSR